MNKNLQVTTSSDVEEIYSLSPLQQGMLFHTLRDKGVGMYVSQAVTRYDNLDTDAFEKAWQEAVNNHDILRASFHWDDPENPQQFVHQNVKIPFVIFDWREYSVGEQNTKLRRFQKEEYETGFDLHEPCLIRIAVIQVTESRWFCINSHHHIILDGWSGGILASEIGRNYEAARHGRTIVASSSRSFGDYIKWIERQDLGAAETFWREHLQGVMESTPLPMDRGLSDTKKVRLHIESWGIKFSSVESSQLELLVRQSHVTLNCVIQAAWSLLLSRYSGENSIMFGTLVSGRPPGLEGVESIVGMFLNTVPFRITIPENKRLVDWLRDLHKGQVNLQDYEYSPLMLVQKWSDISSGNSLFNCIIARKDITQAGNSSRDRAKSASSGSRAEQSNFQQNYPLLLNIMASKGIELKITYDARRFKKSDIARIMEQLKFLLLTMAENPNQIISNLSLLSLDERTRVLKFWNQKAEIKQANTINKIIEHQANANPNLIACQYESRTLCYEELNYKANQVACFFQDKGVVGGDIIGVQLESFEYFCLTFLAALKLGAICFINYKDNSSNKVNVVLVVTDNEFQEYVIEASLKFSSNNLTHSISETDIAVIIQSNAQLLYLSHQALSNGVDSGVGDLDPKGNSLIHFPFNSREFLWELLDAWVHGGNASYSSLKSPVEFFKKIEDLDIGHAILTVEQLGLMLDYEKSYWDKLSSLQSLVCLGIAGSEFYLELQKKISKVSLSVAYITQESGIIFSKKNEKIESPFVLLGESLVGVSCFILDESLQPCPIGIVGELYIMSNGLCSVDKSTLEDSKFVSSSFIDDEGILFRVGINARRHSDGNVEYIAKYDKKRPQLSSKVRLYEVERNLRQFFNTYQVSCEFNDDNEVIALVKEPNNTVDLVELRGGLRDKVSWYSQPKYICYVDELFLDALGYIDLEKLYSNKISVIELAALESDIIEPETELEVIIISVWKEVLKINEISTEDNFFELGGHSLTATKVTARLTKILQSDIPLKGIFESPTPKSLATWILSDEHEEELPYSIQVAEHGNEAPLTFTQQQLWVLNQLFPDLSTYTIPSNTIFLGELNFTAMHDALKEVINRHEVLRTVFISQNGVPLQVACPAPEVIPIERIDLSNLSSRDSALEARKLGSQLGKKAWDLENSPALRLQLVKLAEREYILNASFHHIIADGPSMAVFCVELSRLYNAYSKGHDAKLPILPLQFSDYAIWERDNIKGDLFKKQLNYWRQTLDGADLLEIPTDYPRPAVHGFFGKKVKFELPVDVVNDLRDLNRKENVTTFMSLLAVFQLLLHKYSGSNDVLIGSAMTNRIRVELERLIGLFVNTIPLRVDFSGDPSFSEILKRVRSCCLGAFSNMDLPFEETIAELQPTRDLSRQGSPLFQFMLIHNPGQGKREAQEGMFTPGEPHNDTGHANFDILLSTREEADQIKVTMAYDTELFKPETIDQIIEHLLLLFNAVTKQPNIPISKIIMSSEKELYDMDVTWNGKKVESEENCMHELIDKYAISRPTATALVYKGEFLSYSSLSSQSNQLAHYLRRKNVGPESFVCICLNRSFEMIISILAVLKAGAAFVPMDPAYPRDRLQYILTDTQAPVLITSDFFDVSLSNEFDALECINISQLDLKQESKLLCESGVNLDNLAYVIYTSGSTGIPKGVLIEHKNLSNIIKSQIKCFNISSSSRVLQMLSFSFDAALGEIFRALGAGATLYLEDKDDLLPGPDLVEILSKNDISIVAMSPTGLSSIPKVAADSLPSLKSIIVGGEVCNPKVAQLWGKGRNLLNGYGPTETTIGATLAVNWDFSDKAPLGKPLDGVHIYVLDKNMQAMPIGLSGEMYIGGIGVARGYLNKDELTMTSFIQNPFTNIPRDRLYKTGDLVRWLPSGQLDFLGRIDQQVKIRGFRIELGEIESILLEVNEISQCAVTVHSKGDTKRLIAFLVYKTEGNELLASEMRQFLKKKLPDYMVPSLFVSLDSLPLNNSGKVDKKSLPEPDLSGVVNKIEYIEPKTELEKQLANLWSGVLGLEKIGLNDNFFEVGGDSISAIRVTSRANEEGVDISAKSIFMYQTIAELVLSIENKEAENIYN